MNRALRKAAVLAVVLLLGSAALGQSKADPMTAEPNPKAVPLIDEAIRLGEAGKYEESIAKFKEVLAIDPKDFAAMNSIAGLYGVMRQPEKQVEWAQKSFAANDKFWRALINLGNGYAGQGKFDQATDAFTRAVALAPQDPLPVYSLGVVAENRDQTSEALKRYLKSIELDPSFQNGIFSAAAMHANLRQYAEAKKLLTRLLEIEPRDEEARRMLAAIERDIAKP